MEPTVLNAGAMYLLCLPFVKAYSKFCLYVPLSGEKNSGFPPKVSIGSNPKVIENHLSRDFQEEITFKLKKD
jgi:hypothetical protein